MLKNFFKKNKRNKESPKSHSRINRDLFKELFPLSEENKHKIESNINAILRQMHGTQGPDVLKSLSRDYETVEENVEELSFDCMGWEKSVNTETNNLFQNSFGDYLTIDIVSPSGKLERNQSELKVYREWIRDLFAQQNGGLIYCDEFETANGVDGFESITKMPASESTGMVYTYFVNARNYSSQKLYQIIVRVHEMSPTGIRDNLIIHPISEITQLGIEALMEGYRQDPYDKEFQDGNLMNISEREEFDHLFPSHPLSIIRKEIKPRLLPSLKFE